MCPTDIMFLQNYTTNSDKIHLQPKGPGCNVGVSDECDECYGESWPLSRPAWQGEVVVIRVIIGGSEA